MIEAVSNGPVYARALSRITNLQPLDPKENWDYWTKPRNLLLTKVLDNYLPTFLRKSWVNRELKLRHEIGIVAHYGYLQ